MEILKICRKQQILIRFYLTKLLTLQKIENVMDISVDFLQWFTNFLIKTLPLKKTVINSEKQQLADELQKPIIRKEE